MINNPALTEFLPAAFYQRGAVELAQALLGQRLVYESAQGTTSGLIVETEAYLGEDDPASHAFRGQTKRNAVMFGPAGHAYIYFTYGMHYCFNVVAGEAGKAQAVLIRALEPAGEIEVMRSRRHTSDLRNLTSGPAKLVQALGIEPSLNGADLTQPPLYLREGKRQGQPIVATARIGITAAKELPLRFYLKGNAFISKP